MKFGKWLKKQLEETLPEWRDKFLSYKELKQLVHLVSSPTATTSSSSSEAKFIRLLDAELGKLNAFFDDREEEFVIRQKELQERIQWMSLACGNGQQAEYDAEMGRIRKEIVDLHGEMVLLVNYSSVNYTGLTKILKKYDKRTGTQLRLPFIEKVLKQPFYATEIISKLVKECESTMDVVFPVEFKVTSRGDGKAHASDEHIIFRSTVAALVTMQELRKGSSTYDHFSLPPLSLPVNDLLQSLFEELARLASPGMRIVDSVASTFRGQGRDEHGGEAEDFIEEGEE